jgi:hypothetical protein
LIIENCFEFRISNFVFSLHLTDSVACCRENKAKHHTCLYFRVIL